MSAAPEHDPVVLRFFLHFARLAALAMIAIALLALVGALWSLPLLTSVLPGHRNMKAASALGYTAAGLALLAASHPGRGWQRLGAVLSLLLLGLGATDLWENWWQVDLGIDHLFEDPFALAHGEPPGRLSPATAGAFALLGAVGLLTGAGRWLWLREALALLLLAAGMLGLAYGFARAGEVTSALNPLTIQTAVLLLLGPLGWMASRPTIGLTGVVTGNTVGGAFARRLLLPALLLPVLFTVGFQALQAERGGSEVLALALAALFTGGSLAWMIWWVAYLLDRVERGHRETVLLRERASSDALTGLANRRCFDDALAKLLHGRRQKDATFSLLMLDVDAFKDYNDDFGHPAGDEALRIAGTLLREGRLASDLPARYGGEEFAVLLPGTSAGQAAAVAERILAEFRAYPWPLRPVSVSIGVAEVHPDDGVLELVHRADVALYQAKRAGRGRVVLAD
jgi:diguanylate cyclase (GGDEF)-like protein